MSRLADGSFIIGGASQGNFGLGRLRNNGAIDTNFGQNGFVQTLLGPSFDEVGGIAVQADRKTVFVGQSDRLMSLARYNLNGSLDTSFGTGGKVTIGFGSQYRQVRANGVVLQGDGKIVVAGFAVTVTGDVADADFLLARFLPNGTLDTSFSGVGWLTTDSLGYEVANSIALQPDGKIVVGGSDNLGFAFARYTANGILDTTFSSTGKRSISFGQNFGSVAKVLVQSDGRIVGVGTVSYSNPGARSGVLAVVRLLANGSNDRSFNGTGRLVDGTNVQRIGNDAAVQSDGSILIAGGSDFRPTNGIGQINMAVTKLLTNGARDSTFGTNGTREILVTHPATGAALTSVGTSLAVESNGRIVVGGHNSSGEMAVARLNSDGSPDSSFAGDGKQAVNLGNVSLTMADVALLPDGRIVVAGSRREAFNGQFDSDFILARIRNDVEAPNALLVSRNAIGAIEIQDRWFRDDFIEVSRTGNSLVLADKSPDTHATFGLNGLASITGGGTKQITIPLSLIQNSGQPLVVSTLQGNDRVEVTTNGTTSRVIPTTGLKVEFGTGDDSLALTNNTTSNVWNFFGGQSGSLTVGTLGTIAFAGLEFAEGGDGTDLFRLIGNVENAVLGIKGGIGSDTVEVERNANMQLRQVNTPVFGMSLFVQPAQTTRELSYRISGIESLNLTGGASDNEIDVSLFSDTTRLDGRGGNDKIYGGSGSDIIYGGPGNDLLFGGDGTDKLYGDAGNDILMGGFGADIVYGGSGEDLITGSYFASLTPYAPAAASDAILAAWFGTESYAQRVQRLTVTGVGPSNIKLLPGVEAFGDFVVDTIFGETGLDWFFAETEGAYNELGIPLGGVRDPLASETITRM